ncbi:uncharacterized protein DNG_06860 [Cephalotrichum gorgonifer]|uniref:AAA+ ATPase domain-containing protein n=1 Tax=Cephalotrichum gorgonifer TaxID=2041049 RepID=A0AAE8N199_9PEZI|nr:uncharacterized protein DNG_06860 [Cephalotrichum gorgonifer]
MATNSLGQSLDPKASLKHVNPATSELERNGDPAVPVALSLPQRPLDPNAAPAQPRDPSLKASPEATAGGMADSGLIKYKIEYVGVESGSVFFEGRRTKLDASEEPPVFEYVEVRQSSQHVLSVTTNTSIEDIPKTDRGAGQPYINILSPAVAEALRCVVDYFPEIDFFPNVIRIPEPYSVFVFFEKELTEYRKRVETIAQESDSSCPNRWAAKHIGIVQQFVREQVQKAVDAERERHARGYATYDMLWLLFKPGSDVYVDVSNKGAHEPNVVRSAMNSLLYGANDITEDEVPVIRQHFVDRGRKWCKLRRKVRCYYFDGFTTQVPRHYSGLAMPDPLQYQRWNTDGAEFIHLTAPESGPLKICSCKNCEETIYQHAVTPKFKGYTSIGGLAREELTDHQYFLCDREVESFVFKTRSWELLDVDGFQEPSFDSAHFERLVMKPSTKEFIKNLTQMYMRESSRSSTREELAIKKITQVHKSPTLRKADTTWSADFVEGKGEGLTILLHGRPGVGKTYTAECIADYTERPLLSLTCSDIGVDPKDIEQNLLKWFKLAERWGAIILIDEADIYMEQRQVQDIERNHLVAGFLRALEYYKGILFLTTNRVGTFDEAFMSRIHVQIHYPEFQDEERDRLWGGFFEKLEEDRETTMRITQSAKDYVQSQELQSLKWNGREIRNSFQVAVALAEAQGHKDKQGRVLIKSDHIKATVQMSREFRDYLVKLHKGDMSKKASLMGHRYDAYGKETAGSEKY